MTTDEHLRGVLDRFETTSLAELDERASLQTRIDRKYVLADGQALDLLGALRPDVAVLRIGDISSFRYDTVYFDTEHLDSYLGTARSRRRRFKVRIRTYADSALCMLEIKCKGSRGDTIKVRTTHSDPERLTPDTYDFIDTTTGFDGLARQLRPVLTTSFQRITLLSPSDGSRSTLDRHLTWTAADGATATLDRHAILETKSVRAATGADQWMWDNHNRPRSFSKFCIGMALHDRSLPANKWNRTLRNVFDWQPHQAARPAPAAAVHGHEKVPAGGRNSPLGPAS